MGLWLACAGLAAADQFNHKVILVGDKGAAYGGAFAGLADDATATWYNPAGLTQLKHAKLNVSAQLVQYQKQRIDIADGNSIPYNSFNFSPSITSMSQKMGRWAYGFSLATPQNDLYQGSRDLEGSYYSEDKGDFCYSEEGGNACSAQLNLSYSELNKSTLVGPSLAFTYSDDLSVGVSVYGIYANLIEKTSYGSSRYQFVGGDSANLAKFYDNLLNREVTQTGWGLTAELGILMRLSPDFTVGVMATPGSYVFASRRESQRTELFFNEGTVAEVGGDPVVSQGVLYSLEKSEKHVEISAPSLSVGCAWTPAAWLTLTGQMDYYLASRYSYTGYSPRDNDEARSYFEYTVPQKYRYNIDKQSVVNFSGGLDFRFTDAYSLALGGFTDRSQGPYDTRPASWNRRIDWYGVALSLGVAKTYTESRFGISAAYGDAGITHFRWGYAENGNQPYIISEEGQVVRYRQIFNAYNLAVFLSTTLKV